MKQMFFVLFLIVFVSSCEDELNSPSDDSFSSVEGCNDMLAFNHSFSVSTNDGTCIFDPVENENYTSCVAAGVEWSHHTCINPVDDSTILSWDGRENTCNDLGYIYTAGSCNEGTVDQGDDG